LSLKYPQAKQTAMCKMRLLQTTVLTLLLIFLTTFALRSQSGPELPRHNTHVIIISIDGLIPDYYTAPAQLDLKVPNLIQMKLGGAVAQGVEGVYPTVTYPAHATIVTGVRPSVHGIVQNRIFEPPTTQKTLSWYWYAKDLKAEALWVIARRAGLSTAAVGWPVTVGADIDYNAPEIWDPTEEPVTWKRVAEHATPGLLEKALGPEAGKQMSEDERRTALSEFIISSYRPNLMLIHLIELDAAHHRSGPRSQQARSVAEREDALIGRIMASARKAGIFDKTTFFIVSDHGFARVDKKFRPNVVLVKEKLISLDASGKATAWKAAAWVAGGSCAIVLRDPADAETELKLMAAFSKIAARSVSPINRIINRQELARLAAVPQAAFMLEAAPGYCFDDALVGPEVVDAENYKGAHGYLPSRAEMRASLIIFGEGARKGASVSLARMIDIAPTAAALLGLSFSDAEGSPILELIKSELIPPAPKKVHSSRSGS
jgi:predicted AlkP superfamily pyrophosphatase or phosphodiesterase